MDIRPFALVAALLLVSTAAFPAYRGPAPGDPLPSFILQDQTGRLRKSETLHADRPLVLSFFASNCGPCKRELPLLQQIHKEHGEKVRIVVITLDPEGLEVFSPFIQEHGITFTVLDGSGGVLQDRLGISSLPRVMLVGMDGRLRETVVGFDPAKEEQFRAKILGLAAEQPRQPSPQFPVPTPRPFPKR